MNSMEKAAQGFTPGCSDVLSFWNTTNYQVAAGLGFKGAVKTHEESQKWNCWLFSSWHELDIEFHRIVPLSVDLYLWKARGMPTSVNTCSKLCYCGQQPFQVIHMSRPVWAVYLMFVLSWLNSGWWSRCGAGVHGVIHWHWDYWAAPLMRHFREFWWLPWVCIWV